MGIPGDYISIHAPLAGCDLAEAPAVIRRLQFQSTHPLRGATVSDLSTRVTTLISIHAPLAGCDEGYTVIPPEGVISIHAPLAGCDPACARKPSSGCSYFNPRTPCGVRRETLWESGLTQRISIHAPLAGCDSKNVQRKLHFF